MNTEALIEQLAAQAAPVRPLGAGRRLLPVALGGVLAAALLAMGVLGPLPAALWHLPAPWIKLAYGAALLGAGGWLAAVLARPLGAVRRPLLAVAAVVAAMALVGWLALPATQSQAATAHSLMGHSWRSCPATIVGLSLPALVAGMAVLRRMAPTRLRLAGAAVGLYAGAAGAAGYALACTETSPAFVALWYSLGIALTAALGAALGPRALRW